MGNWIFVLVVVIIAVAAGAHLYQSKNVRKPGTGRFESSDEPKDNPKEKTQR